MNLNDSPVSVNSDSETPSKGTVSVDGAAQQFERIAPTWQPGMLGQAHLAHAASTEKSHHGVSDELLPLPKHDGIVPRRSVSLGQQRQRAHRR